MTIDGHVVRLGLISLSSGASVIHEAEAMVREVESAVHARLPEDYRQFLVEYGAVVVPGYATFRPLEPLPASVSEDGSGSIAVLYGVQSDIPEGCDLLVRFKYYSGRVPEDLLPIGDNGGGSLICIRVHGPDSGKIYYWDFRKEPLDEETYLEDYGEPMPPEARYANVHLIAASFTDFLAKISIISSD